MSKTNEKPEQPQTDANDGANPAGDAPANSQGGESTPKMMLVSKVSFEVSVPVHGSSPRHTSEAYAAIADLLNSLQAQLPAEYQSSYAASEPARRRA